MPKMGPELGPRTMHSPGKEGQEQPWVSNSRLDLPLNIANHFAGTDHGHDLVIDLVGNFRVLAHEADFLFILDGSQGIHQSGLFRNFGFQHILGASAPPGR